MSSAIIYKEHVQILLAGYNFSESISCASKSLRRAYSKKSWEGEEEDNLKKLRCSLEVVEDFKTVNHGGELEGWHCLRWTGFSPHLNPKKLLK